MLNILGLQKTVLDLFMLCVLNIHQKNAAKLLCEILMWNCLVNTYSKGIWNGSLLQIIYGQKMKGVNGIICISYYAKWCKNKLDFSLLAHYFAICRLKPVEIWNVNATSHMKRLWIHQRHWQEFSPALLIYSIYPSQILWNSRCSEISPWERANTSTLLS